MKLLLGPVACQGCGAPVRYIEPDEGLAGWFQFDLNFFSAVPPVILRRHECPAGRRRIPGSRRVLPAQIIPWWDRPPIVFEGRLTSIEEPAREAVSA
jgi:hypothetical protein